jgi:hypothetical protein
MNVQLVESIKQLILSLPQEEQGWLKAQMMQGDRIFPETVVDLNSFSGVIQLTEDPMTFQCQLRDEWV